ncbi:unnamed protein product [Prunus armeniaca]|uniref:Uncharacterized protein n=1 Tax=Prunus armeniaca TaxID=36596 RepID=A0A6J5UVB3_PRUAR|nr:unnamed protein product [Prunus armeniaca]
MGQSGYGLVVGRGPTSGMAEGELHWEMLKGNGGATSAETGGGGNDGFGWSCWGDSVGGG